MKNLLRTFKFILITLVALEILTSFVFAAVKHLIFSTLGVGTAWYVYAGTIVQVATSYLPRDYIIDIEPTGGGISGPILVGEKRADIAFGNTPSVKWVSEGIVLGRPKLPTIRALVGGFDYSQIVVIFTDSFVRKSGITSLEDLVTKKYPVRVAIKAKGSLGEIAAAQIFQILGISYEDIKKWGGSVTHAAPLEISQMLIDGKADITIDVVPPGQQAVLQITMSTKVHFIPLSERVRSELVKLAWEEYVLPANSWPQQDKDYPTVQAGIVLIARDDLPEDVAYALTKAICENKPSLVAAHASLQSFEPTEAWKPEKVGGIPLHPGAERYYREVGWIK